MRFEELPGGDKRGASTPPPLTSGAIDSSFINKTFSNLEDEANEEIIAELPSDQSLFDKLIHVRRSSTPVELSSPLKRKFSSNSNDQLKSKRIKA